MKSVRSGAPPGLIIQLNTSLSLSLGLPDGADAKNLTNTLSADGMLTIQIPVRDYRPPLTPTYQSQQFHLPSKMGNNNNNNMNDPYAVGGAGGGVGVSGGDQQLKLTFDLSGYKPEDVNVKVNNNVLKGRRKREASPSRGLHSFTTDEHRGRRRRCF